MTIADDLRALAILRLVDVSSDELRALADRVAKGEREAAKWKDPSRVTDALVRYLLNTQICDPKWAAPMTRAIYAAMNDEKGEKS